MFYTTAEGSNWFELREGAKTITAHRWTTLQFTKKSDQQWRLFRVATNNDEFCFNRTYNILFLFFFYFSILSSSIRRGVAVCFEILFSVYYACAFATHTRELGCTIDLTFRWIDELMNYFLFLRIRIQSILPNNYVRQVFIVLNVFTFHDRLINEYIHERINISLLTYVCII